MAKLIIWSKYFYTSTERFRGTLSYQKERKGTLLNSRIDQKEEVLISMNLFSLIISLLKTKNSLFLFVSFHSSFLLQKLKYHLFNANN